MKPCTTHHHACDCRESDFAQVLRLASTVMERDATSAELHQFHVRCEKLIGTAYPLRIEAEPFWDEEAAQ
jgi:hypothetical protein